MEPMRIPWPRHWASAFAVFEREEVFVLREIVDLDAAGECA